MYAAKKIDLSIDAFYLTDREKQKKGFKSFHQYQFR